MAGLKEPKMLPGKDKNGFSTILPKGYVPPPRFVGIWHGPPGKGPIGGKMKNQSKAVKKKLKY